jgi:hypothetical protein
VSEKRERESGREAETERERNGSQVEVSTFSERNLLSRSDNIVFSSSAETVPEGSTISVASPLTVSTRVTHVRQGAAVMIDNMSSLLADTVFSLCSKLARALPSAPDPRNCNIRGDGEAFIHVAATFTSWPLPPIPTSTEDPLFTEPGCKELAKVTVL